MAYLLDLFGGSTLEHRVVEATVGDRGVFYGDVGKSLKEIGTC